jgi:heat shock protein HtpX
MLIGLICCAVAYVFTLLTRFAISRKREYMADAGGAELCGNPLALASALRKISDNPGLTDVNRDDVAQLFIIHPQGLTQGFMSFFSSLFSTHPDTAKRIEILEQF